MARKPNYQFERMERDRAKATKLAAKAAAKRDAKQDAGVDETIDPSKADD
jgi:hypothetical protein